jgi:hypothetical protein
MFYRSQVQPTSVPVPPWAESQRRFCDDNSRHVSGVQAVWDAETQKRNASPAEIPQSAEPSDSPFVTAPVSFMTFVSRHFRAHAEFQGVVLSR